MMLGMGQDLDVVGPERIAQPADARRLRVAIGHPGHKDKVTGWVLGKPGKDDEILIGRAIDEAIEVLPLAVAGNFMDAMTRLHTSKE